MIIGGISAAIILFVFLDDEMYRDISLLREDWPVMIYIVSIISLFAFSILSATMYSRFIVSEYSQKRVILLFAYPIRRSEILKTKCLIIALFTLASVLIASAVTYGSVIIIAVINNPGTAVISRESLIYMLQMLSVTMIFPVTIGMISGYMGLGSDSIQTTIISALILSVIATQIIGYIYTGDYEASFFTRSVVIADAVVAAAGVLCYKMAEQRINNIEIE